MWAAAQPACFCTLVYLVQCSFQAVRKNDDSLFFSFPSLNIYAGQEVSWDDFLPSLSYVIVECNKPHILIEVEYMMELLEPSWLGGEGRS